MTRSNHSLHSDLPSARRVVVNFCQPWNGPADAASAWASSSAPSGSRQPRYGCLADVKPTGQIGLRCATVGERRQGLSPLVLGQLGRSAHMNTSGPGSLPAFACARANELAFEFREATQYSKH